MSDAKYFTTTKKGEIKELKKELDNPKENVKKEAVKKVKEIERLARCL
jgi:AP-1 complex subunit beta-1